MWINKRKVRKVGNSLVITITNECEDLMIRENEEVFVYVKDGRINISCYKPEPKSSTGNKT